MDVLCGLSIDMTDMIFVVIILCYTVLFPIRTIARREEK